MLAALLLALAVQDTWQVRGVLVDEDGEPLVRVPVHSPQLKNPAFTNDEGAFHLELPANPRPTRIEARPPGRPVVTWMVLKPAAEEDLGRVCAEPGGVVVGRIVNAEGGRATGNWTVDVEATFLGPHRAAFRTGARLDPVSGEFRVEGVPSGIARFQGWHSSTQYRTRRKSVIVEPDVETYVEIEYLGPDPERTLGVVLRGVIFDEGDDPMVVTVIDSTGARHTVEVDLIWSGGGYFQFRDLGPGPYRVEVADERVTPIHAGPLDGGTDHTFQVRGSVTLEVEVRDTAGHLVGGVDIDGTPLPSGTGRLEGLLPGERTLLVSTASCLPFPWTTPDLPPGISKVVIEVPGTTPLVVTCLDAVGDPMIGVPVSVFAEEEPPKPNPGFHIAPTTPAHTAQAQAKTDTAGRATFRGLHQRRYSVVAALTPWVRRTISIEGGGPLVLRAPPLGEVVFEVQRPGTPFGVIPFPVTMTSPSLPGVRLSLGAAGLPRLRVPAGRVEFEVELCGGLTRTETTVEVPAGGSVTCELDLTTVWPATLEFEVLVAGRRTRDFQVFAEGSVHRADQYRPGPWTVTLTDPEGRWLEKLELDLEPGERRTEHIDVTLLRRRILVLDADGEPLRNKQLRTLMDHRSATRIKERTDDEGYLTIERGPGRMRLLKLLRRPTFVTLEEDGPETLEIRLERD